MRNGAVEKVMVAGAACLVGVAGAACALTAPRHSADADAKWAELARWRYAHRGLYDPELGIPENSLPAFRRARAMGFGSELDVHLTADGALVVIHDSDLLRMTGQEGTVERLTLAELGSLTLAGTSEHIPTFEEVLEVYACRPGEPPAPPLVVEVKTFQNNVEPLCVRTMAALDASTARYCMESFDPRVPLWLRRERPEVVRGQLAQDFVNDPTEGLGLPLRIGSTALWGNVAGRPDFVAYRFCDLGNPALRLAVDLLGAKLATWTLKSEDELVQTEERGGIGIFEGFVPSPQVLSRASS